MTNATTMLALVAIHDNQIPSPLSLNPSTSIPTIFSLNSQPRKQIIRALSSLNRPHMIPHHPPAEPASIVVNLSRKRA